MSAELHLRSDQLFGHAAAVADLSEHLRSALTGADVPPTPHDAETERLRAAVGRTVRDLAELSAVLAGVAVDAQVADDGAAIVLHRVADGA